jgi:anaerobic magnesium-protoporphyrin IX monomethyl ester cyclase
MKRILLASMPFYRLLGSNYNGMNLGIASIASVLKFRNYNVGIYNADYYDSDDYLSQEEIYNNYENYLNIINNANHPLWKEVAEKIIEWNPDYLGISINTANYPVAKIVSKKLKQLKPSLVIVLGGVHATLAFENLIRETWFDLLIRGEGEFAFLELVNGVPLEKIGGLSYRDKSGNPVHNIARSPIDPLDILPFPSRELYITPTHNMDLGQIITSRGCPFKCTYCASSALWRDSKVRYRSVHDVVTELEFISKKYQSSLIYISDDTFTLKKNRTIELCDEIMRRNLNITWKCDTRADCLDNMIVGKMKMAGCELLKIGVESGSKRILKQIKKGVTKDKIRKAIEAIKNHGIKFSVYLMIGFPGETDEDVQKTIDFAKEIEADYYSLSTLSPYYGTEIYDYHMNNCFDQEIPHWEYFYHQNKKLLVNSSISDNMFQKFLSINDNKKRI